MTDTSTMAGGDLAGVSEYLPAPRQEELIALDGLIDQAADLGPDTMDDPLAKGLVRFGPYLLDRCQERFRGDQRLAETLQRAWVLFGMWMGGQLYTEDARELERRARAGLELWRRGGEAAQTFELLAAQCVLALPFGHPLRDEMLAQPMIEAALQRAREARDHLGVLRCSRTLLWSLNLPWDDVAPLIDEGLASVAALGDDPDSEAVEVEGDWRFVAAFALSQRGQALDAASSGDSAHVLHERALQVYEPVVTRQPVDPDVAIRTVWNWGHLLMNANYPTLAGETFAAVRALDREGSDLWWHATYEEGLVRADMDDWSRSRGLLSSLEDSLLTNYAAWICLVPEAAELGTARLSESVELSAQRELCEGLGTLALAEATDGDWEHSFRHLETTKALDYRQRAALRHPHQTTGVRAARTAGHSGLMHGVPVITADDERARLTTILAEELRGPTIEQVARSLEPDQAVLSLGVGQGTWGVCVTCGDLERPSGTFLRTDVVQKDWTRLLGELQVDELFRGAGDISGFDAGLSSLLGQVDELIACPVAELVRERGIRHLAVIPHGWLNLLPVWALPSFSNVPVSFAAAADMVVDAPRAVDMEGGALVVVDPIGDLPAAHAERAALERHGLVDRLALRALTGARATVPAVSAAVRDAGLVHVAGHATGNALLPSEAGLVLAADTPSAKGRLWRAGEIEAEADALTSCALVVLSACESGRGGVRLDSISDYSGLPPALLALGVSAVVATLWRIPDDLGALFADVFYERLAAAVVVDLPELVHDTARGLRTLTGAEGAERLMELRAHVDDAIARVRLEAYARRLRKLGVGNPFAGPAAWATFYHTGVRYVRLPDPREAS